MISRILVEFVETDLSRYALNVDLRITLYAKNANLDIGEEEKKYIRGKVSTYTSDKVRLTISLYK